MFRNLILVLFFAAILVSCKKSNEEPTIIQYELVSTNTTTPFEITYTNSLNQNVTINQLSGWKLEFMPSQLPFSTNLRVAVTTTATFNVTARIYVNGTVAKENNLTTVSGTNTINISHLVK